MGRWPVVIPYYIFGSLVLAALMSVVSRIFRFRVSADQVATTASIGCVVTLAVLLGSGTVRLDDLRLVPLLGLLVGSLVIAGVDELLSPRRPLSDEHGEAKHRTTDPRVF